MRFHIGEDRGDYIVAWLIPDNPSKEPQVTVDLDGQMSSATVTIQHSSMVENGAHETGNCGFEVSTRTHPGLTASSRLRLIDDDSGLVIYERRRNPALYIERKLFVFDMRPADESAGLALFRRWFHMNFPAMHRFGNDARRTCIGAQFTRSILFTGGICVRADEPFLSRDRYHRAALIAHPAQLLIDTVLDPQDAEGPDVVPMIVQGLSRLSGSDLATLTDPLTRRLASLYVDDFLERDAVAVALDTLSRFDAIGVESALREFRALTLAVIPFSDDTVLPLADRHVSDTAKALREEPIVAKLLARDFEIYDSVHDAVMEARTLV